MHEAAQDQARHSILRALAHDKDDRFWTMVNLDGMEAHAFPDTVARHVTNTGGHTFAPAGVLACWLTGREIPDA